MALPLNNTNNGGGLPLPNSNIEEDLVIVEEETVIESPEAVSVAKKPKKVKKQKKSRKNPNEVKLEKDHRWVFWAIGSLIVLIAAGIVFLVLGLNSGGDAPGQSEKGKTKEGVTTSIITDPLTEEVEAFIPLPDIDVEDETLLTEGKWNENGIYSGSLNETIVESDAFAQIVNSVAALPSEAAGYTSDLSKLLLEDGTYNPMFSYWTQESFSRELTIIIEALTNPFFGGWANIQMNPTATDANLDSLYGLYEPSVLESLSISSIPLFVDWSGGNFGYGANVDDSNGVLFTPRVTMITNEFNFGEEITVNTIVNATFTGRTKSGENITKNATLSLDLVQNKNGDNYPRVLIRSGSLKVG